MFWPLTLGMAAAVCAAGWAHAAHRARSVRRRLTAAEDERRRLSEELDHQRRTAERHAAVLRSSMDGVFIVDQDCRFLEVNEAFCRMTGYSADELRRMRISDLEVPDVSADDVPSHMRTGLHHFPTAHRHKDGHVIFLEISMNVLRDDDERILAGFARDVTERKRAAEEFERLSRRQQLILNSTAEGICGVDPDGRITFANPAASRMLASAAADLVGRSLVQIASGDEHSARECSAGCVVCTALRRGLSRYEPDTQFRALDGRTFSVEYSITPMYDGADVIGGVAVFRDITERKAAEQQRRALESQIQQVRQLDSLGMLAGGIAHDLNNMLVGILGNACLAVDELPDVSNVRGRLQRIISACERASKVISQILAYSGRVVCEPAPADPNEFLGELAELLRPGLPPRIELRFEPDP
ncbi:MAG: PAS domain S-box protein, partial [Planctomycetota bacterium]